MPAQVFGNKYVKCMNGDVAFYCIGCDKPHYYRVEGPGAWSFNGNFENPTFEPSFREYMPERKGDNGKTKPETTLCHFYLRAGKVQYLHDCAHSFRNQTIDVPELPLHILNNFEGWFGRGG